MTTNSDALERAVAHHRAGRLHAAEEIYAQILAADPDHADALHLRGVIALHRGQNDSAVELIRRAIELKRGESVFHCNLGSAWNAQGKLEEAVDCFRRALELNPDYSVAHYNLGTVFQIQGKLDDAESCFRRAVAIKPDYVIAQNNLGNVLQTQGKLDEAVACFRGALELNSAYAEAHYNLGIALQAQGKREEAVSSYRRAVELNPDFHVAHSNLANALQALGKPAEALASHGAALRLRPDSAEAHCNVGSSLQAMGKLDEAVECFRRATELKPGCFEAHYNLGTALQAQEQYDDAVASYRRALALNADQAAAHFNLGTALCELGKVDEGIASYRKVLKCNPDFVGAFSNLLVSLPYRTGVTPAELAESHAEYESRYAAPLRGFRRPHTNERIVERKLRVGFISPNFVQHPVGHFVIGAIENLDRRQCEIVCYSDREFKDEMTARFEAAASEWQIVNGLSDPDLAEKIRADRIDILFDLAGHTAKNRLLVFARKPAPIQVTWADYVGTTGLKTMDYILADRYEIPPGAEAHFCERILRMPDGYVCYDPPAYAPRISPLPALKEGAVTFGSFNYRVKITSEMIGVWARILHRLPRSRLVLKYRGMNCSSIANGIAGEFAGHGIDPRRIEFLGWSPHAELLAEYGRIDLALDTFPYNGGLTTCEALWMGVPVITCPGETFASRHSLSHLTNAGCTDSIARDLADYVEVAVTLASNLPRLAALRGQLRERVAASPLCDSKRFAENLMRALRDIWRAWCGQAEAER